MKVVFNNIITNLLLFMGPIAATIYTDVSWLNINYSLNDDKKLIQ